MTDRPPFQSATCELPQRTSGRTFNRLWHRLIACAAPAIGRRHKTPFRVALFFILPLALACGCAHPSKPLLPEERNEVERQALLTITTLAFDPSAAVRMRAIEALQDIAPEAGVPYYRESLNDDYRGVRFAALMAIGTACPPDLLDRVRQLAEDPETSVRAAAIFAMHRLGDKSRTTELANLLLNDPRPEVRANSAMILGRLGEEGALALLELALKDRDESVRLQVLEAMARLGSNKAVRELGVIGISNSGQKIVFALRALAASRRQEAREVYEFHFAGSPYDEVRLTAAHGLGTLGDASGLAFALDRLRSFRPSDNPDDPPQQQHARVKMLASLALESIGDPAGLRVLKNVVQADPDPSVRIAAARAILSIAKRDPFPLRQPVTASQY